jgi:hypothetical protein
MCSPALHCERTGNTPRAESNGFCREMDCGKSGTIDFGLIKIKTPSGPRFRSFADRRRRPSAPDLSCLDGCTLQKRIVPTGGASIPARPRDSGWIIRVALDARCRRSRLLRVHCIAWGTRSRVTSKERAPKRTRKPLRKPCAGHRATRMVLVSRCEHAACRLSLGVWIHTTRETALFQPRGFLRKRTRYLRFDKIRVNMFSPMFAIPFHSSVRRALNRLDVGYVACV